MALPHRVAVPYRNRRPCAPIEVHYSHPIPLRLQDGDPILPSDAAPIEIQISDLLSGLTLGERDIVIRHSRKIRFARHDLLFRQGDESDCILIIEDGLARIF